MRIAVNGATGYTGRLTAAELVRRGIEPVLIGRDAERLERLRTDLDTEPVDVRIADVTDPGSLAGVFDDCDAVVNCAGPFTVLGEPVVRAAIAAGCHYVDTTGEQRYMLRVFDRYAADAKAAGVAVVPGLADDGGPADLIGGLTASAVAPVAELTVGLWYRDGGASRGTLRSMLAVADDEPLDYVDGQWVPNVPTTRESIRFPGADVPVPVATFGLPPIATIPRHVEVARAEGFINADLVAQLRAVTPELVASLPDGPPASRRRQQRWTHVVEAAGTDGRMARGEVEGSDGYATTAVIAIEGARRLVASGTLGGVLAPAQAFNATDFLNWLTPHGVHWRVRAD